MIAFPRFTLSTLALLLCVTPTVQADTLTQVSQIQNVTVHPGVATVTRTLALQLPAGEHTLLIPELPAGMDEASLQLSGVGAGLQIGTLEIRHIQAQELVQPEAQRLQAQQQQLQDQLANLLAEGAALTTQETFLQALAQAPGKPQERGSTPLAASEWQTGVAALGEGMRTLGLARVKLAQ